MPSPHKSRRKYHSKAQDEEEAFREFYGEEVALHRKRAGLTQQQLSEMVVCSAGLIAQWETGRRLPRVEDAERLDNALGTDDYFQRMRRKFELNGKFAAYFATVAELEPEAAAIYEYAVTLAPGLLQTEAYTRAVFWAFEPNPVPADVDRGVANRMERARIFDEPKAPTFWAILNEAVLRTVVGSPAVMTEQLRHIAVMIRSGRVFIQVVPFSAGAHPTMESPIRLMRFEDQPDLAYVEGVQMGALKDDPAQVKKCWMSYDMARAAALSPKATLALIESVAEVYEHGHGS